MSHHSSESWVRLGKGDLLTEDSDTGLGHIVSIEVYTMVYVSLLALTGITVWAAGQDFGMFNLFIALAIATVKAGVVTLFFMHLNYENKIIWGIVIYPIFIFVLLVLGTLGEQSVKSRPVPFVLGQGAPAAEAPAKTPHVAPAHH